MMGAVPCAGAALTAACERLALSRDRLRKVLLEDQAGSPRDATAGPPRPLPPWLQALAALPGASIVIEALRAWWSSHPLHLAGQAGAEAARAMLQPVARSHPLALVLGALLLGGMLAWTRPWRWIRRPAWLAGLWPQLFYETMARTRPPESRPAPP